MLPVATVEHESVNREGERKILLKPCCYLLLFFLLCTASPAWAVQTHGGSEGLVSHQIGHVLFVIGIIVLLFRMSLNSFFGKGWRTFKGFLWMLVLWNCLAFSGHWMQEVVSAEKYITESGYTTGFQITNIFDIIFYLTQLDHLLLVPAFFLLFLALGHWEKDI